MRRMPFADRLLRLSLLALPLGWIAFPSPARAQVTQWTGTVGNWGEPSNWSDGEPTAGVDAEVLHAATITINQVGEVCRNLTTGTVSGGSTVMIQSGTLDVANRIHVAAGANSTVSHSGGTVAADELAIGFPTNGGAYTLSGGSLTLNTARIALDDETSTGIFTMAVNFPVFDIADSLRIGKGGRFNCGAGTLRVGNAPGDGVLLDGVFTLSNAPFVSMTDLTMTDRATLSIAIGAAGVSSIAVSGTAVLNGQLLITDIGATEGTYLVLTGSPIQGTFDSEFLPPGWSWRVEGTSLLVTKGGGVPVQPTTWGVVKSRYTR